MVQSQCLENSVGLLLVLEVQCPKSEVAIVSLVVGGGGAEPLNFQNVLNEAVKNR